jgi:fibronectin type 3 domain-containing protein
MKRMMMLIFIFSFVLTCGCSKEHKDLPTSIDRVWPATPTDFEVDAGVESAVLTWSYPGAIDSLSCFNIYWVHVYFDMIMEELRGTTDETNFTDTLLIGNNRYCYMVSAVNKTGLEGRRTQIECVTVQSGVE